MRFTFLIALLLPLAAYAGTLRSQLTGVIRQSIPRPPDVDQQGAEYFKPGVWSLFATKACGDGDVASFSSSHPQVAFAPVSTTAVPVVVGYWQVPAGATGVDRLPTASNFVPIALGQLDLASGTPTTSLVPVNDTAPQSVLPVTLSAIGEALKVQGFELRSVATPAKFDLYAGAMACPNPGTPTGSGPTLAGLASSLETTTLAEISAAVQKVLSTGADPATQLAKFDISLDGASLHAKTGPQGSHSSAHPYFAKALELLALNLPSKAADVAEYSHALETQNPSLHSYLTSVVSDLTIKTSYEQVTGLTAPEGGRFFWEVGYPLQLQARAVDPIVDLLPQLYSPSTLPTASVFQTVQKAVAQRLFTAAITERVLFAVQSDLSAIRQDVTCLRSNPYIEKLYGSLVFNLNPTASEMQSSVATLHPEGNTAVGGYAAYDNATTGNLHAIYEMGSDGKTGTPLTLTRTAPSSLPTSLVRSSNRFEFQIREVGCSGGRPYCKASSRAKPGRG